MNLRALSHNGQPAKIALTFLTAVAGAAAFGRLHLPIPWLLGPMVAGLIGSSVWKGRYAWPGQLRNTGMILVGYTIGLSMTGAALREMGRQLPTMLLLTLLLLLLSAGIGWAISRLSGNDFKTVLLGCIPGGLTQVLLLAEETEGVNLTVVTVIQVTRLMMIIICVPLIVFSPILGQRHGLPGAAALPGAPAGWGDFSPTMLVFAAACVASAIAGNRVRFPTAYLLGPAFATALLQLFGLHGSALPSQLIDAAQFLIGTYVGLLLKPGLLTNKVRTLSLALGSGLVLLAGALVFSLLLSRMQPVSQATALLGLAPGGMDQMGIIAHEIHADLSMVAGYQLFRTFFIFFAVPPLVRLIFRYEARKRRQAD